MESLEIKGNTKKYIANVELTNRHHSYNDTHQLPELKLSPRTPTPPPYRTKNNVSISLRSPRGWKNENVIVRSPISSVVQQFENRRNGSSPVKSQTKGNFFFSGGNVSPAKLDLETQQDVRKYDQNLIQPRDITKSLHRKNSEETSKAELKPLSEMNIVHDVSHIVDKKEALRNRSFERFAYTINNEIQDDSIANKDSGLGEFQERFTDRHIAERIMIEDSNYQGTGISDKLNSRGKEDCVEDNMNANTIDSKLSHDSPSIKTQRRRPQDYSHDTYINHKLENTRRQKLENSNDYTDRSALRFKYTNHTTVDSIALSNEKKDDVVVNSRSNKVKTKYHPTIILCKSVNEVNNDSTNLSKRTNIDEVRHFEAPVIDQQLEEETKTKLKYEGEELKKFLHCEYNIKNKLRPYTNTTYENQSTAIVNQDNPPNDRSEGGEVLFMSGKGEHTVDLETDIRGQADHNEESKTDVAHKAVGKINVASVKEEVTESNIKQSEIDVPEDNKGLALNKSAPKKEDKTEEDEGSTRSYRNHTFSKDKESVKEEKHDMASITTIDPQANCLNDIHEGNRVLRAKGGIGMLEQPEHKVAEVKDQLLGVKDRSSFAEDKSKYEHNINSSYFLSTYTLEQVLNLDSNLNSRDLMDQSQNIAVSEETEGEQMESVGEYSENSTVVNKTVNVILEETDEVDISSIHMKDQSTQDTAAAKNETNATHLLAGNLNSESEQSKGLIKNAKYKGQETQELIVQIDSSVEISDQSCNNVKEVPENILNTDVNTNHLSDTHVLYQNTAQTGDATVDHNIQKTKLISKHHENGAQALHVINQFVKNNVMEKTNVVSKDDFGIFSAQNKDTILKQSVNKLGDQTGEVDLGKTKQTANICSAREMMTLDNGNSAVEHKIDHFVDEARQVISSHYDDSQNKIPGNLLMEDSGLTREDKESYNLHEIGQHISTKKVVEEPLGDIQIDQAEKVSVMQNDTCLVDETEDSVYDKGGDALDPDVKQGKLILEINDEKHEHERVKISNDTLTCTDNNGSTVDQQIENTQLSKGIANQVTDEESQWKNLSNNHPSKEHQADNVNDALPTITLHSSDMQTTSQLPKADANESQQNSIDKHNSDTYKSSKKLNGDISGIPLSDAEKTNDTVDGGNKSGPNIIYPQVQQNLEEQKAKIDQQSHLSNSEKYINEARMTEHTINCAREEETESSENMENWVSKLRQLETPEFMKHLREPRQPRSSALSRYATLPPIKEDQGSPKSIHFDRRLPSPETKEKKVLSEESESTMEPKVAEQTEKSEQNEKKYAWERNTDRSTIRTSPLELMRKHTGDEVSRSDSYKAFIAQSLSQRQSSIIGSLLLSEKLDKKTDTSEGKSFSRLESSFLLSSYLNPQKDKAEVTEEIETVSENATSENDITTTNDNLTSTTEDPKQEDHVDFSIPKIHHVTNSESNELPSNLDNPISSPLKVFPDVWHHPEKSHGKLNPRPGKIILCSEPGFRGHVYEIYSDVANTHEWELRGTISVRIIRGGWLLYEKPHFRGRRVMLSEGDTDLTCPWEVQDKSTENVQGDTEDTEETKSWIGSLRHVVRDFQVPRISLFMDENGEGNKCTILGSSADSCVNGQPIKTESIIVHSGLWLVYSKPFFEGDPYILGPGGYPNRKAWNGHDSHLCSLQPTRIGGPTVERPNEPKILLFEQPDFEGLSWEVTRDLHSIQGEPNQQGERLSSVGSLKVLGGCWVAYEKEGFHGHQYLLEEGEYEKWPQWGGCSKELGSLRHIRTDFSESEIILYENPGCLEGSCLRLNEALADIEVAQYGTNTGSIQVLNGVWVAYENVDFSGEQYILEKGIYHSYQDWGAKDSQICSVQPVLQVGGQSLQYKPKIQLFSEPHFHGDFMIHTKEHVLLPNTFSPQSCRIERGSWILYEGENCSGEQYVLVEGDYPTRTAMGCQAINNIQSFKRVPLYFSIPSISLHGLERFEGKELQFTGAIRSLQGEGYNNHVLSIKVASGIWVLYEHSDFRGRQWLLEQTEITNWLLFSGIQRIGSLCPIRQRRVYFRLRNCALGLFLCVPEPAENMKAARVQVTEAKEGSCDLWYYEEGRIKNQMTPQMSLQVVGMTTPGTKVVMWSEGRKPIQTWSIKDSGLVMSCLFEGLCLDIKGGHSYDSDHVVVWEAAADRLTQHWKLEVF